MKEKTVAITGASGFIGGELVKFFLSAGWKVIGMGRKKMEVDHPFFSFVFYDLTMPPDFSQLSSADVIIHCAFLQWSVSVQDASPINIQASIQLAEFCRQHNKQFVFFSSFSAHETAVSSYGRHKFQLENMFKQSHLVIKPGLVIGAKGLYAVIDKTVTERTFIPVIGRGEQPIQWIDVKTLCNAVMFGIDHQFTGVFALASVEQISFLLLLEKIAYQKRKSPYFIFLPVLVVRLLMKLFGSRMNLSEENLNGLLQLKYFDTKSALEKFQIRINPI